MKCHSCRKPLYRCGYPVKESTYRRAHKCERFVRAKGGKCAAHVDKIKGENK